MNKDLIIFGNGEIADLAYYYFKNDTNINIKYFCIDEKYIKNNNFNKLPILSTEEVLKSYSNKEYLIHVALSYSKLNEIREEKFNLFLNNKFEFISYVSSKIASWPNLKIGHNCFILENQTLQPNIKIGNNVMLWSGNHIGHGSEIGDHTYLSSHVVVSGNCKIGKKCFFGVNSTIKDFTTIGNSCFIGMGALVNKNLKDNSFVLGQRSNILDENDRISIKIKKDYFNF